MDSVIHDTLILSDLHLGSQLSRAEDATRMLKEQSFRRLILLGDIFSDLDFGRLTKEHWKFLGYIRKLSNPKRRIEVVWVEGNHDRGLSAVMSHLVGVEVYQEYEWEYNGLRQLAIHGHQFDRFVVNNLVLSAANTFLHLQLQKLDFKSKRFSRYVDQLGARWLRLSSKVASGAIAHAKFHGVDRIFCGHTHSALHRKEDGIEYYNTGCWTDAKLTYVTVDAEGVRIHVYKDGRPDFDERSDHCDSGEERSEADSVAAGFADQTGLREDAEYEGVGI